MNTLQRCKLVDEIVLPANTSKRDHHEIFNNFYCHNYTMLAGNISDLHILSDFLFCENDPF